MTITIADGSGAVTTGHLAIGRTSVTYDGGAAKSVEIEDGSEVNY